MDKDYLLKKWLSEELSDEEFEAFKKTDGYETYVKLNKTAKNFNASNFIAPEGFEKFKSKLNTAPIATKNLNWHKPLLKIASLLVIIFSLYFVLFSDNQKHIEALAKEKITVNLPDSSEIILNAVSKISYNEEKWDDNRELTLNGEAFFKVTEGSVFDVNTSSGKISVLGTQFNVKNRSDFFEVICYDGKVSVQIDKTTSILTPGHSVRVVGNTITKGIVDDRNPNWISNQSSFNKVPFIQVLLELERQYDVNLDSKSIDVKKQFTGGFTHNGLDEALKSVTSPLHLTYDFKSSNMIVLRNSEN